VHREGLAYGNGVLYESTGLQHHSTVRTLDPKTGSTIRSVPMKSKYFGEGLTFANGKLVQLTYKSHKGFVYNATDLQQEPVEFDFHTTTGEGWGITYDTSNNELIVSDGSSFLQFWDPNTFQENRKLPVARQDGKNADKINELEFWRGRVLANIWYEDTIIVINPESGIVEKEYGTFSPLLNCFYFSFSIS
jgi:glutaminyl-peptide cyclotransferase